jgi:hypothetical protein
MQLCDSRGKREKKVEQERQVVGDHSASGERMPQVVGDHSAGGERMPQVVGKHSAGGERLPHLFATFPRLRTACR